MVQRLCSAEAQARLESLEASLVAHARELALLLVYDRPSRLAERPGLARTYFAQRCVTDEQLELMIGAFRDVGAYVELFEGEQPFISALSGGRLSALGRRVQVAYNGIGWGVGTDAFQAGRKALVPLLADSYGVICANSNAHACALVNHKFHCFTVLAGIGLDPPATWHFRPGHGWIGRPPPIGERVIAKSTYEAWSVGVTDASVFYIDETCDERVATIADEIGQAVTVQEFIAGVEVHVPVFSCPERIVAPAMEAVLSKAPSDPEAVMTINDNLTAGGVTYRPFDGSSEIAVAVRDRAADVFDALGLDGFSRIDFRIDKDGRPRVFDVSVSPGLEPYCSGASSLARLGFGHAEYIRLVVAATLGARGVLEV